jgi:hypothetical protein
MSTHQIDTMATDDIEMDLVDKLRLWASTEPSHVVDDLHKAADEIERLRADRKELLQIAKLFADEGVCRMYEEQWGCCTHSPCDWHDAEHMWESFCMSRGL